MALRHVQDSVCAIKKEEALPSASKVQAAARVHGVAIGNACRSAGEARAWKGGSEGEVSETIVGEGAKQSVFLVALTTPIALPSVWPLELSSSTADSSLVYLPSLCVFWAGTCVRAPWALYCSPRVANPSVVKSFPAPSVRACGAASRLCLHPAYVFVSVFVCGSGGWG